MNIRQFPAGLACCLLSCFLTGEVKAQTSPMHSRNVHLRNDCRFANQVITRGEPSNKLGWALEAIQRCGAEGGRTLARVVADYKNATIRVPLVERVLDASVGFQDRSLLETGLAVSRDAGASEIGRIQAIRLLFTQVEPTSFGSWEWFIGEDGPEPELVIDLGFRHGAPLPPDYLRQVIAGMLQVEADPSASDELRTAAERVRRTAASAERRKLCTVGMSARECADASRVQP